jgi:hypothetical protein
VHKEKERRREGEEERRRTTQKSVVVLGVWAEKNKKMGGVPPKGVVVGNRPDVW